jgi:hypothetical protein
MSAIQKVQEWYRTQCDGDWEHSFGVKISTLDNPGWTLTIDLTDTPLEKKKYAGYQYELSERDWIDCRVEEKQFRAAGGPMKLEELMEVFLRWKDERA